MKPLRRIRHLLSSNLETLVEKSSNSRRMLDALTSEMDDASQAGHDRMIAIDEIQSQLREQMDGLRSRVDTLRARAERLLDDDEAMARDVINDALGEQSALDALIARNEALGSERRDLAIALAKLTDTRNTFDDHLAAREKAAAREKIDKRYATGADKLLASVDERLNRLEPGPNSPDLEN